MYDIMQFIIYDYLQTELRMGQAEFFSVAGHETIRRSLIHFAECSKTSTE